MNKTSLVCRPASPDAPTFVSRFRATVQLSQMLSGTGEATSHDHKIEIDATADLAEQMS